MNFKLSVFVLSMIAILTTHFASATIEGSTYEERHQSLIEKSIYEKCGVVGQLFQVASAQENIVVDNGITDIAYTTSVKVRSRIDQNIFEEFNFVVQSLFSDAYDLESKNWGIYSVESISSSDRACH